MLLLQGYDFEANIHLYRWKELNILLDVNSGAIHILDELARRMIEQLIFHEGDMDKARAGIMREFQDIPAEEIEMAVSELEEAIEEGSIFSQAEIPEVDLSGLQVKAICLNVAHACNMKCHYCFAAQGDFGGPRQLMSLATAQKALDFLVEKSGDIRNLEVDFFGGEPLLVAGMLKELVCYARSLEGLKDKHFNFTLTTNALLLDDGMINFVNDNKIGVILSLDGRKETNDRHRILNNGEGTYDLILPKIKKMVESQPVSYYVRGTFSRKNLDFSADFEHIVELGFDCLSLEPAVGPNHDYAIQEEDLSQVLPEYEHLTDLLLHYHHSGKKIHFFHYNLDLQKGPCLAKRSTGCGAGIEYLVITPEGDIYPCHQFVGIERFYMGNIQSGEISVNIRKEFEKNQLRNKVCKDCWARYFCGGGCHAGAYYSNADLSKPHQVSCIMHRKRIEGAIYLDMVKRMEK
ncbi:MAG: thioether cross-link-forming SCIFF peptide maturase [Syntrophomonas sp.]